MQQSLNTLMIELICDSSPTFKPNVERSFYTSQIFYPKLAFLKNINTLEDFQKNIDDFAASYNLKFNKKSEQKNLFKKLDNQLIENHICPKHKAKIANGIFVTFNHRALAPINEQGKRMLLKIGGYLNIHLNIHLNLHTNELFTIFENRKLLLVDVNPNLLFEDQCENLMIAKRKFELEKQRQANKTKFIN